MNIVTDLLINDDYPIGFIQEDIKLRLFMVDNAQYLAGKRQLEWVNNLDCVVRKNIIALPFVKDPNYELKNILTDSTSKL